MRGEIAYRGGVSYPGLPGNMPTASKAARRLAGVLEDADIFTIPWSQDKDSGIDLIGFIGSRSLGASRASAFTAGFQSRGTKQHAAALGHSVKVGNHEQYWLTATMPVFVASIDLRSGRVGIEDVIPGIAAGRSLQAERSATRKKAGALRISTPMSADQTIGDMTLRIISNALTPWLATVIRSRPLGQVSVQFGMPDAGLWSVFARAVVHGGAHPHDWNEVSQLFSLIRWLYEDDRYRNEFLQSCASNREGVKYANGLSVLAFAVTAYLQYRANFAWVDDRRKSLDLPGNLQLLEKIWHEAGVACSVSPHQLAQLIFNQKFVMRPHGGTGPREAGAVLQRVLEGEDLSDVLRELVWISDSYGY